MADTLLTARTVDAVLTALARGYSNATLVAEALFPIAYTAKEGNKIPVFGKDAFKIFNTERAIRAASNRLNPTGRTTVDVVLTEHDIAYPVDVREAAEDLFNARANAQDTATRIIQLRREYIAAVLAQDAANYASTNKITLAGTDQFTHKDSDPIGVIEDAKDAVRGQVGADPNTLVIGASSYKALKKHAQLMERIKYSMKGVLTPELMAEIFDVEKVVVGKAIYQNDAGTAADVWADNLVLAWVPGVQKDINRSYYNPAYGYTLRKTDYPIVDEYDDAASGGKVKLVRCTDIFIPKIVGADAGYLIKDTNAPAAVL